MYRSRLEALLPEVRERIALAAGRAGRNPAEVRIVAITKEHGPEAIEAALEVGLRELGENRVERIEGWVERFGAEAARWHMVGHLQRRKAARAVPVVHLLHSLDSTRLAERLTEVAPEGAEPLGALVQVNTSGEETKGGFHPESFLEGLGHILTLPGIRVEGLMTMAPYIAEEAVIRRTFGGLRTLQEEAVRRFPDYRGRELSMGMSNDYEVAVEEGSTIVRLGTVLFGGARG